MSSLKITDQESAAVQKTPNRVTLEKLENYIEKIEYLNPDIAPQFTLAIVKMKNGFVVVGESAPADPCNFNTELGKKFAYENAVRKIWPLMGFALCDELFKDYK